MTTRKIKSILFIFLFGLFLSPGQMFSQTGLTYKMEFIKAVQQISGDKNDILTFLKVTPTVKDFKLVLSMRVTYEIGQGTKTIDVQKQKEDNIKIVIYGKDLAEKNPKMFDLIKEDLKISETEDMYLIVFNFFNITKTQIDNMSIQYGLWEGKNQEIRNEQTFNFKVEPLKNTQ